MSKSKSKQTCTLPNGMVIELFPIRTLAERVGRTSDCIRKWEIAGVIPKTSFRDAQGNRLYTKEQIDVVYNAAEKYKLCSGRSIHASPFPRKVAEGFKTLSDKYFSKGATAL